MYEKNDKNNKEKYKEGKLMHTSGLSHLFAEAMLDRFLK